MNLNPLFLNKLMSMDNAQVIAFPKLESQQFLFSNIIKVYEEDIEIPQSTQNLFAEEKPDLLISELSQILSSLENNQNLAANEELSEVPKLVNEKEITEKEFVFDKTTVKELINKIRQLLDANKDLSLEVKKIPLNVDSIPEYSFEIKIKTESKEVLVTIIPTSVNNNPTIDSKSDSSAIEGKQNFSPILVENPEVDKTSAPNSDTLVINNKSEIEKINYDFSVTGTVLQKDEVSIFKENGINKEKPQIPNTKVDVAQQIDIIPNEPETIESVLNAMPNKPEAIEQKVNTLVSKSEPLESVENTVSNKPESLESVKNTIPSKPEPIELVVTDTLVNIDEEDNGYFEAPVKQSKQSPFELTLPKKHFSVKVQESSEKINLASEQKITNNVEAESLNTKLPSGTVTSTDTKRNEIDNVPAQQKDTKIAAVKIISENVDVMANISIETKEANNLFEPKSQAYKSSVVSDNKEKIKIINIPEGESKTSTTGPEAKNKKVVIKNVLESEEVKDTNNIIQPKVAKEAPVSEKVSEPMKINLKIKEAEEVENTTTVKEPVKAESAASVKDSGKTQTPTLVKEIVKTENAAPVKETVQAESPAPVKETVKLENTVPIKETITVEKTQTAKEASAIDNGTPFEEVMSIENENNTKELDSVKKTVLQKEVESKDIKNSVEEKEYKVKIEVKNSIESIAPKVDKVINKPSKEFEIFEISGMMKSIKSDNNKEFKTEDTIKMEKENTISSTKKVTESESKADTGNKNEFSDKNLQQFTKNSTIDRVEAPKEKVFSELHNMQESIRLIKSNEIVKEINKILVRPETQSMTFQITPDELGKIKLVIDLIENRVSAKIEVESEQVRQIVQNNIEQLKSSIQSSGVQVSSLNVSLNYHEQKANKNPNSKKKNAENENNFEIEDAKEDNSRKKMGYSTVEFLA